MAILALNPSGNNSVGLELSGGGSSSWTRTAVAGRGWEGGEGEEGRGGSGLRKCGAQPPTRSTGPEQIFRHIQGRQNEYNKTLKKICC